MTSTLKATLVSFSETPTFPNGLAELLRCFDEVQTVSESHLAEHLDEIGEFVFLFGHPTKAETLAGQRVTDLVRPKRPFLVWWLPHFEPIAKLQELTQRFRVNLLVLPLDTGANMGRALRVATPEGGLIEFNEAIALKGAPSCYSLLKDFILKRANVQWFQTKSETGDIWYSTPTSSRAYGLLQFAHETELLRDRNGNAAVRIESEPTQEPTFVVSPRGVNKAELRYSDLLKVRVDTHGRTVHCTSLEKSSIDTGVLGMMFDRLPDCSFMLHFHPGRALVCAGGKTQFPYPCGTVEEGDQLYNAITAGYGIDGKAFLVEMVHHGYLLGGDEATRRRILTEWETARAEYREHLRDIGEEHLLTAAKMHPILVGPAVYGVFFVHEEANWGALYVSKAFRGRKVGARLAALVAAQRISIAAHDECEVLDFYLRLGWKVFRRSGATSYLTAPGTT